MGLCLPEEREGDTDQVGCMQWDEYSRYLFWKVFINTFILGDCLILEDWYFQNWHHFQMKNFR